MKTINQKMHLTSKAISFSTHNSIVNNLLCFVSVFFIFSVSSAFATQTVTDIYNSDSTADFSVNDGSSWKIDSYDGATYTGAINATIDNINNLNIKVVGSSAGIGKFSEYIAVKDLNYTIDSVLDKYWGTTLYFNNGIYTTGNTIFTNAATESNFVIQIRFGNKTFKTDGDFSISSTNGKTMALHSAAGMWEIGGNINIGTNAFLYLSSSSVPTFNVNGIVNLNAKNSGLDFAKQDSGGSSLLQKRIGGLNGIGKLQIGNISSSHELTFTNSKNADFSGTYATQNGTAGRLNLIMSASNSSAVQNLRFQTVTSYSDEKTFKGADIGTVIVDNGTLNIGMNDSMSATKLTISGADAAFGSIGLLTSENVGTSRFTALDWSAGKINVDFTELAADKIEVSGAVIVSNIDALELALLVNASDLSEWLLASEVDYLDYTIMTFDKATSNITVDSINGIITTQIGVFAQVLENDFANGNLTLRVSVPEPATLAGLFGVIALAFAIYRHRKS